MQFRNNWNTERVQQVRYGSYFAWRHGGWEATHNPNLCQQMRLLCTSAVSPGIQTLLGLKSVTCCDRKRKNDCLPACCLRCLKWVVLHWITGLTVYWMTISAQFILFSVEVDPIATPAADFSLCIFDHYSFIFCRPESGTKLLHRMIYDIPFQRRMKNKLDFPTPFPDQPCTPTQPITPLWEALPLFITPASLFLLMHVAAPLQWHAKA